MPATKARLFILVVLLQFGVKHIDGGSSEDDDSNDSAASTTSSTAHFVQSPVHHFGYQDIRTRAAGVNAAAADLDAEVDRDSFGSVEIAPAILEAEYSDLSPDNSDIEGESRGYYYRGEDGQLYWHCYSDEEN
ncbi:uncharacterized protein LOC135847192 [Planococcus citri]|uniref:uncharacterized protein LOC135847192 n=1 Tax=Planococcus citri TaxID=170843 RepID=UPI0031F9246D